MINCMLIHGVGVPLMFLGTAYLHLQLEGELSENDGSLFRTALTWGKICTLAVGYHALRIGPYFMNFAVRLNYCGSCYHH